MNMNLFGLNQCEQNFELLLEKCNLEQQCQTFFQFFLLLLLLNSCYSCHGSTFFWFQIKFTCLSSSFRKSCVWVLSPLLWTDTAIFKHLRWITGDILHEQGLVFAFLFDFFLWNIMSFMIVAWIQKTSKPDFITVINLWSMAFIAIKELWYHDINLIKLKITIYWISRRDFVFSW